jgi:hypothetical protein
MIPTLFKGFQFRLINAIINALTYPKVRSTSSQKKTMHPCFEQNKDAYNGINQ